MSRRSAHSAMRVRRTHRGFTLIELMVAMLLGLVVIAGVSSVFLAAQRSYRTNGALGDVQDSARTAFELMAHDIRQAGLTGCTNNGRVSNVISTGPVAGGTDWWANWNNAIHGYDTTQTDPAMASVTNHVAGTESLQLLGADDQGLSVVTDTEPAAEFKLNHIPANLDSGDIVMVCDPDHAALTQITKSSSSNVTVVHNTGGSQVPGNCSKGLGYPSVCTTNGNSYTFGPNSQLSRLIADDWYLGTNSSGGTSLYRLALGHSGGNAATSAQEMVRNVTGMHVTYHEATKTGFVDAASVADWSTVDAVRVQLTVQSNFQRAGTDNKPLTRTLEATTTLRNRVK